MPSSLTAAEFSAEVLGLSLPMGLVVTRVLVRGVNLTWRKGEHPFELPEPGSFEAHVSSEDLAAFLNRQSPGGLKNFKVQTVGGKLKIEAVKTVIIDVPATAICSMRIAEARQLFVDLESVEVLGAGVKSLVQAQLDQINPIFDANDFPAAVELTSVSAEDGAVVLCGTLAPKS